MKDIPNNLQENENKLLTEEEKKRRENEEKEFNPIDMSPNRINYHYDLRTPPSLESSFGSSFGSPVRSPLFHADPQADPNYPKVDEGPPKRH